jgi:hypothetical protein
VHNAAPDDIDAPSELYLSKGTHSSVGYKPCGLQPYHGSISLVICRQAGPARLVISRPKFVTESVLTHAPKRPWSAVGPERTFLDLYQPRRAAFHELLAAEPMLKLRSMKRQDHEPASSGPEKPRKPSRTEEAQRIVEEYSDGLREILKKLRKLFH